MSAADVCNGAGSYRIVGSKLLLRHFYAMIIKRFRYLTRSKKGFFAQVRGASVEGDACDVLEQVYRQTCVGCMLADVSLRFNAADCALSSPVDHSAGALHLCGAAVRDHHPADPRRAAHGAPPLAPHPAPRRQPAPLHLLQVRH